MKQDDEEPHQAAEFAPPLFSKMHRIVALQHNVEQQQQQQQPHNSGISCLQQAVSEQPLELTVAPVSSTASVVSLLPPPSQATAMEARQIAFMSYYGNGKTPEVKRPTGDES